jgi:hypothetical protein
VGRTVELALLHRLKEFVEKHKALPEFQIREVTRRHNNFCAFVEQTTGDLNIKKSTGVFSRFKKAFDRVWHESLLRKLRI